MQATRPRAIVDLIHSAENFRIELGSEGNLPQPRKCERCGYICSQSVCKACQLLEGLNKGLPSMGISRPGQVKSRAATKLAADKLRAVSLAENNSSARAHSCSGNGTCEHGDGHSADKAQTRSDEPDCSAAESCEVDNQTGEIAADNRNAQGNGSHTRKSGRPPSQQQAAAAARSCSGTTCECAAASAQTNGVLCVSNEDWALPSDLSEANDASSASSDVGSNATAVGMPEKPATCHEPVRAHGNLYESNLREVDAHPSARRPVRAAFGTSW